MPVIHRTALVDRQAELADDVQVGAYAIIKGHVTLGPGCVVQDHSHIHGRTILGRNCKIGPSAFIGMDPQHLKYNGEPTLLIIGDGTQVRECASIHRAFLPGEEHATRIGQRCYIMSGVHVGHDCVIGNDVILSSGTLIGGHCQIADRVFMGGASALHQFVRVGRIAIFAGQEASSRDVPPFAAVRYHGLKGYNAVGCRRAGLTRDAIHAIRGAYHCIHHHRNLANAVAAIRDTLPMLAEVQELLEFVGTTKRGIHPSIHFRRSLQDGDE